MDVSHYNHSNSISIDSSPADVYAIVSDITRIGELSPVCQSCAWDDPAEAERAGAWFTGHNVIGEFSWDTHCQVSVAEPGREFTFVNHGPNREAELVRWGFTLEPDGAGTKATESWQVLPSYPTFVQSGNPDIDVVQRIAGMAEMARTGIQETLANLKRVAEA
jgi:carbon monoxide dehydrogenase subunit G